jgi:hypothetical protein
MRLIVKRFYHAGDVTYTPGTVITIDDPVQAAWLIRDGNGGIEELDDKPPVEAERIVEAASKDRMVRKASKRSDEGPITRETFKAVRDK